MANNKLEFQIGNDNNIIDPHHDMLSYGKALLDITKALDKIVKRVDDGTSFQLYSKGSACLSLEAPEEQFKEIESIINNTAENLPNDLLIINSLNKIRARIAANGIPFTANIFKNNISISVIEQFKSPNKFSVKREKKTAASKTKAKSEIVFLHGKLIEFGGAIPNIDVQTGDKIISICCTIDQAKALSKNSIVYEEVYLSAWVRGKENRKEYIYCDFYRNWTLFEDLRLFIEKNLQAEGFAAFEQIHYKLKDLYDVQNFEDAQKLIRLFLHETTDIVRLRSILIISKYFKNNVYLNEVLDNVLTLMEKKTGKPVL